MTFYVLEFQTGEVSSVIPVAYDNRADAEAAYHHKLEYAAKSNVRKHGCMLCNEDMFVIKQEIYTHYSEPNEVDET